MTGDRDNKVAAMDLNMIAVADTVMISMNFNNCASLAIFFIILVLFCIVFFLNTKQYAIQELAEFDFCYRTQVCNLTECENLQYSDCSFRFVSRFLSLFM